MTLYSVHFLKDQGRALTRPIPQECDLHCGRQDFLDQGQPLAGQVGGDAAEPSDVGAGPREVRNDAERDWLGHLNEDNRDCVGRAPGHPALAAPGWPRSARRGEPRARRRGAGAARGSPSENRHSMARLWPSSQPSSRRPSRNAWKTGVGCAPARSWDRTPIRRRFVEPWARASSGRSPAAAAAPPSSVMNSRRLTPPHPRLRRTFRNGARPNLRSP